MTKDFDILTPKQVADELTLSIATVRSLMRRGIIPSAKIGGSWRTTRGALYGYLENQMGMAGRVHDQRKEDTSKRIFSVQRRSKGMDKGRESPHQGDPQQIFFER